jgi:hypothetical protein
MPVRAQDNKTKKHKDNMHASSSIRTHDPNNQAASTYSLDRAAIETGVVHILAENYRLNSDTLSLPFTVTEL